MNSFDINSAFCRLKYPYRIVRNKLLGRFNPIIVVLVVNNKCNLRCLYCFGEYCKRKEYEDFTTEELKNIIDELYSLGVRVLTVHGGETLLREDIGEIVDYIKSKGVYINFITNGLLLKKKADLIRNVDNLCISLDGRREGHDKNRGYGTFEPTLEAIKFAKREGFRLRVQGTITRYTMHDIEFLAKLAKEIGYFQMFSVLYQCGGVSQNFKELMLNDEGTKIVIRDIIKWKRKGYPIYTAYKVLYNALNWPFSYSRPHLTHKDIPIDFKPIPCFYGKTKFTIDADGFVYPCFSLMDEFKALNLREVGLKKAIQHVINTNRCVSCFFLTNNDHNLLLGFSVRHILAQCRLQLKELLGIY